MFVKPIEPFSEPLQPVNFNTPGTSVPPALKTPKAPADASETENKPPQTVVFSVPTVMLDSDSIAIDMAANLANSLLGHVLFLKSQIPFPVVQLSRMSGARTDTRAGKKRVELMTAMDTLSSHLHTTFAALSNAFAQRRDIQNCHSSQSADSAHESDSLARVHMAFVVGPSIGAPKARVVLVLDGLEIRSQGVPEDLDVVESQSDATNIKISEEQGDLQIATDVTPSAHEDEAAHGSDNESDATEPPPSRTPSPSPPPSCPSSPSQLPSSTISLFTPTSEDHGPLAPLTSQRSTPKSMAPPKQSHAEGQQILRAAERLLARTLTSACAEDDGGLSAELAPAQTHVFLRAPRRFAHPAWVPRQNYTRSMEGSLETFMNEIVSRPANDSPSRKRALQSGIRTEGVWITCKSMSIDTPSVALEAGLPMNEEDEMIWWEWNGKIIGFSDW